MALLSNLLVNNHLDKQSHTHAHIHTHCPPAMSAGQVLSHPFHAEIGQTTKPDKTPLWLNLNPSTKEAWAWPVHDQAEMGGRCLYLSQPGSWAMHWGMESPCWKDNYGAKAMVWSQHESVQPNPAETVLLGFGESWGKFTPLARWVERIKRGVITPAKKRCLWLRFWSHYCIKSSNGIYIVIFTPWVTLMHHTDLMRHPHQSSHFC